ncbi:lipopolysaccharide biosynthesis protein [Enterobacter cloacae]|uniref:lipopolysaccharide biosynthesis protein n=1 Tax=Enterobacter cloacae complex TaxID=354276 RepID=UPI0007937FBD|nr:hypothetical protein [Enterobacter cloacae]MCM7397699.1 hypothetical protein [Enterobacter cloacae]MDS0060715.1 hypothetical protein [Enterobacter cloacae subsp. cloacae]MDS0103708.1 hypothetical protein [Enterobacter cloacae subsp. cloacae]MDW8494196.1 hypothetical protein [Enterobacter cloacae subsp. cloacae]QGN43552.1 hypothetical protein GJ694_15690 [Enterobacter cloacae]
MRSIFNKLFPLSLRGGTLASKFILIIFISRYYNLSNLGEYALVVAGVSYVGYLLGFDFYTYSSRKIIGASETKQASYIKNQFSLYFLHYSLMVLFLLVAIIISPPWINLAIIFVALIILDHCSQEVMRLLVIYEHPLSANVQFFIRNGLWVYIYILFVFINGHTDFDYIWFFWIAAEIISLLFAGVILKKIPLSLIFRSEIDWKWVISGIKVCLPLLISTLSLRGIFTADRYILGLFDSKEAVGIYSYFSSFSSSIMAFVDAGVVMLFYPKLVKYAKEGNNEKFISTKRKFLRYLILTSVIISLILVFCVPVLSEYSGKKDFLNSLPLFYVLISGSVIYCISLVYHFELYAKNNDKAIIISGVTAFCVSVCLMFILGYLYSSLGIAASQLVGIIILFLAKSKYCRLG